MIRRDHDIQAALHERDRHRRLREGREHPSLMVIDPYRFAAASGLTGRTWGFVVSPGIYISEMEIRGSVGGADLTSPGQDCGCDTNGYWQAPASMFDNTDGDFGYGYVGDGGTDWLQVDFGSSVTVAEFAIKPTRSGTTVIGGPMTSIEVWRASFARTASIPSLANGWTYVTTFSSISGWVASSWKTFAL